MPKKHLGKLQHFPGKLKVASVLGSNGVNIRLFALARRINLHLNILRIRFFVRSLGEVLLGETIESLEVLVQGLGHLPSNLRFLLLFQLVRTFNLTIRAEDNDKGNWIIARGIGT